VGLLLNLVPNHLDRHGDFGAYERMKARLFAQAQAGRRVRGSRRPGLDRLRALLAAGRGTWHSFGADVPADYAYRDGHRAAPGARPLADLRGTYFGNDVLGGNAAGVIAALHQANRSPEAATGGRARLPSAAAPHGTGGGEEGACGS
jgi:UDP-N-acetylmuramoylalanine--D-glutamate ligase